MEQSRWPAEPTVSIIQGEDGLDKEWEAEHTWNIIKSQSCSYLQLDSGSALMAPDRFISPPTPSCLTGWWAPRCGLKFFLMGQWASTFSRGLEMLLHLSEPQFRGSLSFRISGTPLSTFLLLHRPLGSPPTPSPFKFSLLGLHQPANVLHSYNDSFFRDSPISSSLSWPLYHCLLFSTYFVLPSAPTFSFCTMGFLKTLFHFTFLSLHVLNCKMGVHYIGLPYREERSWGRNKCNHVVSGGIYELWHLVDI